MVQTWRLRQAVKMSSVCIKLLVIVVTLSLSDVACQTVHNINISDEVHSGGQRQQAEPLTQQQISYIVNRHNILRSREGAANMKLMVWDTSLASEADKWAARCHFEHTPAAAYGQNLFMTSSNKVDVAGVIEVWHSEKQHYNFNSKRCSKVCGHYTQVVWAETGSVGCAAHLCPRGTIVVCNYSPHGNMVGARPYKKGPACSKCSNGAGWCMNELCNTDCSSVSDSCWCAAICYNCAKLDFETCRCNCTKGWRGPDCSQRCKDKHKNCTVDRNAKAGLCPPVLGPAADSAQSMFIHSHQSTMIIVMVIIAFTIITYDAL